MSDRLVPRLFGPRTFLTIPEPSAAPRLTAYFSRNRERLAPVSPPFAPGFFSDEYQRRRLELAHDEYQRDVSLRLFMFKRGHENGAVIGVASFTQIFRIASQRCVLGYSVDRDHEGQGLLREGLDLALAFVFEELGLHRVEANYLPTNERSGRLLRRLGFTVEGYARDYLFLGDRWCDHILTSKTNPQPKNPL